MTMSESKRWRLAPQAPDDFIRAVRPLHPLVGQVLHNRGFVEPQSAAGFLDGRRPLSDPFALAGVERTVALIREAILGDRPIVVYGDYDVDGITACAVLLETLSAHGARVTAYIPSREDEGYGLNEEAIRGFAEAGVGLLITVDCGMRAVSEVALARQLGLTMVVTDHHQAEAGWHVGGTQDAAAAVINPKCSFDSSCDDADALVHLAGVGVAFKLSQALISANRLSPLPTTVRELEEVGLLDLVALGTVADMVMLVGENHTLVSRGLVQLNSAHRPGLSALLSVTGVEPGEVTTKTIGFVLAPRLNAAGRLDEAMTALELLLAPDMATALPLAQRLDALNQQRREITLAVREKAHEVLQFDEGVPALIFAASPEFPPGIVGLAASRLLDDYYRPAVVVSVEEEVSKGSARSIPEFHITEALDAVSDLLVRHGGHAAAAGFTVETSRLVELETRLVALAEAQLGDLLLVPTLAVDAETPLHALNWDLFRQLERLQPFGLGNPVPIFVSRGVRVTHARAVGSGQRHLKLYLADEVGRSWDAIAFGQGHWAERLPRRVDLAYMLEQNTWNGEVTLQLNVQDIRPYEGDSGWVSDARQGWG
jgi:single-stranded-DNA-specific exonuclease